MIVSVQLYSLRDPIEREGLETVLATVKKSGFDGVETAGLYGKTPEELRAIFDKAGLTVTSMHVGLNDMAAPETLAKTAKTLGATDLVVAHSDAKPERVDELSAAVKALKGFRVGYHNHAHEFEPQNAEFLDKLLASDAYLEPDIFWLKVAGIEPIEFLKAHAKKIQAIHLKELSPEGWEAANPVAGQGVSGCKAAVEFAAAQGHRFIVLEVEKFAIPYGRYLEETARFIKDIVK